MEPRAKRHALAFLPLFTALVVIALALVVSRDHSSLYAEYSVARSDIGIPGISKLYEAKLVNRGFFPVQIEVCDAVTDVLSPEIALAYAVERWDPISKTWTQIADLGDSRRCTPYPLGWVSAQLKRTGLRPGQSISGGEEATAARGFHRGDSVRFVAYSAFRNAGPIRKEPYATAAFAIDEEIEAGVAGLRVKH